MQTARTNKQSINKTLQMVFMSLSVLFIILLTFINIKSFLTPPETQVLGAVTQSTPDDFWKEFLSENDNYIPGWIEIGRIDKAAQIDPNYFLK